MNPWSLRSWSRRQLSDSFESGSSFAPEALSGWVYQGLSLGLPAMVDKLTWVQFAKAFDQGATGTVGWNIRVHQTGHTGDWQPMENKGQPRVFGHFAVSHGPQGIELDYGRASQRSSLSMVRDPLVSLSGSDGKLLLGRTMLQIGKRRLGTPSYFVLERGPRLGPTWGQRAS